MIEPDLREVIVVGGGPAGVATAIFLHRQGHDVLLVDEARFPRDKVCGEGISPQAWRSLELLGLTESVRALHPYPLRGMTLVAPDGTCFRGDYRDRQGLAVRRWDFDRVLLEGARTAGVEVEEACRVTDLIVERGQVQGVVVERGRGPQRLGARLVVGADGRRSVVGRKLGLLSEHRRFRKFAVRGYWEGVEGLEERGEMHAGGGGYCGIAPLATARANVAFVLDEADMAPAAGDLKAFYRTAIAARWPRIGERLTRATLCDPPRAIGPLALVARGVSAPGALLVGDAAGFYDPFTGEGVTLALRSAEIASQVAHRALQTVRLGDLRPYDRLRRAATQNKFRFNRLLQTVVGRPRLANLVARRLAGRPDLADRLVGVAGDFLPAQSLLGPSFLLRLLFG